MIFVPNLRTRGEELIECSSSERSRLVTGRAANGASASLLTTSWEGGEGDEDEIAVAADEFSVD